MALANIDTSLFPQERAQKLGAIYRYSLFDVMLYRSNLLMHSQRVQWIVDELTPFCKELGADIEKTRVLALVHDDAEMIIGDIQAGHKAKMSKEELAVIEEREAQAARTLAAQYPKEVHGYNYEQLLLHAAHKDCIEAEIVSYADRFDAYSETLHEVLAGNLSLVWALMFYERWVASYLGKQPALKPLTAHFSPFILAGDNRHQPMQVRAAHFAHLGKPHTRASLDTPTEFPFYNAWREMVVRRGGEEGRSWLTQQREFLPK